MTQVNLDLEASPIPAVESQASSSSSILDKLKVPTKSDLSGKCKIKKPRTATAQLIKTKSSATNQTNPKEVSPAQHDKDFPNECLEVKNSKVFCNACREELALKKRITLAQVTNTKKSKERLARKEAREGDIALVTPCYYLLLHVVMNFNFSYKLHDKGSECSNSSSLCQHMLLLCSKLCQLNSPRPSQVKRGIIQCLRHRTEEVCQEGKRCQEIQHLRQVFRADDYPESVVKSNLKAQPTPSKSSTQSQTPPRLLLIPYIRGVSEVTE